EREILTRLGRAGVAIDLILARGKPHPTDVPNWTVHRFGIGRGLRWWVAPFVVPPAIARVHRVTRFDVLRGHSVGYLGPGATGARRSARAPRLRAGAGRALLRRPQAAQEPAAAARRLGEGGAAPSRGAAADRRRRPPPRPAPCPCGAPRARRQRPLRGLRRRSREGRPLQPRRRLRLSLRDGGLRLRRRRGAG